MELSGAYGSLALDKRLTASRLDAQERAFASSLFYGVIERKLEMDYLLSRVMDKPMDIPMLHTLLRMGCLQLFFMNGVPDFAACTQTVEHCRRLGFENLCPLINGVMRSLSRLPRPVPYPEDPVENLAIRTSTPEWLVRRLLQDYPHEETVELLKYRPDEFTATLRPNLNRISAETLRSTLEAQGFAPKDGLLPGTLRVRGNATLLPAFRRGLCSIQGEGSMLAAYACTVKPGWSVLDACAAPGGKSCLLAEQMQGAGRVHAWDLHPHRVRLIAASAGRLGLDNVRPRVQDATQPVPAFEGALNAVLVDAPCSGLGVSVQKPDIKYRLTEESLAALPETQHAILSGCAPYVRPGGVLVYSTCTILPAENREVVDRFLKEHPEFRLEGLREALPAPFGDRVKDGCLQLLPHRDGIEGFFIARMVREG